ncbi:hypothetical protein JZ751_016583 [Albula glossodonta]|uniref:thioredoxin-dependent peroxiredoxin n=1 Tax=Albula glossodonta TaxID=121402 RepID=A0A8T2N0K7_9TELE|nr:hypothetical protein JZ751_016583 [Albula glossodonta]
MGDRRSGEVSAPRVLRAVMLLLPFLSNVQGSSNAKNQECHNFAGGHVYPGETVRVAVSDHSLHLSKAQISKPAPVWEATAVINGEFKLLKLSDYHGKYLVFFFYPMDFAGFDCSNAELPCTVREWITSGLCVLVQPEERPVMDLGLRNAYRVCLSCSTFVCPTEIMAFSDRVREFRAIGAEVVACSTDSQFTHLAW